MRQGLRCGTLALCGILLLNELPGNASTLIIPLRQDASGCTTQALMPGLEWMHSGLATQSAALLRTVLAAWAIHALAPHHPQLLLSVGVPRIPYSEELFQNLLADYVRRRGTFNRFFTTKELLTTPSFKKWRLPIVRAYLSSLAKADALRVRVVNKVPYYALPNPEAPDSAANPVLWNGITLVALPDNRKFRGKGADSVLTQLISQDEQRALRAEYAALDLAQDLDLEERLVEEILDVYMNLKQRRSATPETLLEELSVHRLGFRVIQTPERLTEGLRWLESRGFVLRRIDDKWLAGGISQRLPSFNTDVDAWPNAQRDEWIARRKDGDHPRAIAARVRLLLAANLVVLRELPEWVNKLLVNWERPEFIAQYEAGRAHADHIDQGVERIAAVLGIEPVILFSGYSRAEQERRILEELPGLPHAGARFKALRQLHGYSRTTLLTFPLLQSLLGKTLHFFETGKLPLRRALRLTPRLISVLAEALRVDPFLILEGRRVSDVVAEKVCSGPTLRMIRYAFGLTAIEFARRFGYKRPTYTQWEAKGVPLLTTAEVMNAARGSNDPADDMRRTHAHVQSGVYHLKTLESLYAAFAEARFRVGEAKVALQRSSEPNFQRVLRAFYQQGLLARHYYGNHRFSYQLTPAALHRLRDAA